MSSSSPDSDPVQFHSLSIQAPFSFIPIRPWSLVIGAWETLLKLPHNYFYRCSGEIIHCPHVCHFTFRFLNMRFKCSSLKIQPSYCSFVVHELQYAHVLGRYSCLDHYKTNIPCKFDNKFRFWHLATIMDVVLIANLLGGFNFDHMRISAVRVWPTRAWKLLADFKV